MISIRVNGEGVDIDAPMTLDRLLDEVDAPAIVLAVEINAEVIPHEEYAERVIRPGDEVEVVTLVGGG